MSSYRQAKTGKLMIEILPDKCDFCGCCVGVCPEDAIELSDDERKQIELMKANNELEREKKRIREELSQ